MANDVENMGQKLNGKHVTILCVVDIVCAVVGLVGGILETIVWPSVFDVSTSDRSTVVSHSLCGWCGFWASILVRVYQSSGDPRPIIIGL